MYGYRKSDRPLDYTPLQRGRAVPWRLVLETAGWGAILVVPFLIWCSL